MKKRTLLCLSLLALAAAANAQTAERQVLGATGGSFSGTTFQADYTVGETVTTSGIAGSFSVNQGFQQNTSNGTAIEEKKLLVNFTLYPNPAQDQVTLSLNTTEVFELKLSLSNVAGQLLLSDPNPEKISGAYKRDINLQQYAAGIYFLNLYDVKNGLLQSIRFVKQ